MKELVLIICSLVLTTVSLLMPNEGVIFLTDAEIKAIETDQWKRKQFDGYPDLPLTERIVALTFDELRKTSLDAQYRDYLNDAKYWDNIAKKRGHK